MVQEGLYETVCPACNGAFDVAADAAQGNCPHCNAFLRFIEEENVAPATPAPESASEPAPESAAGVGLSAPTAPAPSGSPGLGEFRVECPQCRHAFNVGASLQEANCPACASALVLEDVIAERGIEFAVACPACSQLHEVPIDRHEGRCPHCQAQLLYEDVFAGRDTPTAPPASAPQPDASSIAAMPTPAPLTAEAPPPVQEATMASPSAPAARPATEAGLPLVQVDPGGIPLAIDCPSCKRAFGVPPGAREGNCPHCNIPLAFVTDKEYLELQVAEERKRRMQQKLAAKRALLKAKEEERRVKEEASRPEPKEVELASTGIPKRRFGIFRRGGAGKETAAEPTTPLAIEMDAAPAPAIVVESTAPAVETSSAPPPKAGRGKKSRAPAPPAPADVVVEVAPTEMASEGPTIEIQMDAPAQGLPADIVIEPASQAPPADAGKPKKGLFGRFRKAKPSAEAPAALVETSDEPVIMMETSMVEAAPLARPLKKGRKAPPEPTPVEASIDVSFEAAPEPAPGTKRKGKAPPSTAMVGESTISFESEAPSSTEPEITIEMEVPVAASAAVIETGDIVLDAPPAPAKPPRRRRR